MKRADTKERLLEAGLKLISEKGYLGATTREIAQAAEVTELTLFRHFGSKEKLFEELLNSYTFLPKLRELLPELETLPYEEALKTVALKFLLRLKERKSMVKITCTEINLYPDKIREVHSRVIEEIIRTLATYFQVLVDKGVMRNVTPHTAAKAFFGMFFSYFRTEEIIKGTDISRSRMEKVVQEFVDIFVHGTLNEKK